MNENESLIPQVNEDFTDEDYITATAKVKSAVAKAMSNQKFALAVKIRREEIDKRAKRAG